MPRFDVDDLRISPDDFLSECDKGEIEEAIEWLVESGKIRKIDTQLSGKIYLPESMFQEYLSAIANNYHQLTNDEEKIIIEIGKKFKI